MVVGLGAAETGQRLVEQQQPGIERDRAPHLEPLALAERQRPWRLFGLRRQAEPVEDRARLVARRRARAAGDGAPWIRRSGRWPAASITFSMVRKL